MGMLKFGLGPREVMHGSITVRDDDAPNQLKVTLGAIKAPTMELLRVRRLDEHPTRDPLEALLELLRSESARHRTSDVLNTIDIELVRLRGRVTTVTGIEKKMLEASIKKLETVRKETMRRLKEEEKAGREAGGRVTDDEALGGAGGFSSKHTDRVVKAIKRLETEMVQALDKQTDAVNSVADVLQKPGRALDVPDLSKLAPSTGEMRDMRRTVEEAHIKLERQARDVDAAEARVKALEGHVAENQRALHEALLRGAPSVVAVEKEAHAETVDELRGERKRRADLRRELYRLLRGADEAMHAMNRRAVVLAAHSEAYAETLRDMTGTMRSVLGELPPEFGALAKLDEASRKLKTATEAAGEHHDVVMQLHHYEQLRAAIERAAAADETKLRKAMSRTLGAEGTASYMSQARKRFEEQALQLERIRGAPRKGKVVSYLRHFLEVGMFSLFFLSCCCFLWKKRARRILTFLPFWTITLAQRTDTTRTSPQRQRTGRADPTTWWRPRD